MQWRQCQTGGGARMAEPRGTEAHCGTPSRSVHTPAADSATVNPGNCMPAALLLIQDGKRRLDKCSLAKLCTAVLLHHRLQAAAMRGRNEPHNVLADMQNSLLAV